MYRSVFTLLVTLLAISADASHLSEKEVLAIEASCQQLRQERLAPERKAVLRQCLESGEKDGEECRQEAAEYGEMQVAPFFRPAKYSDLPECQEAYKARKHYDLNPGS
jgi:hypothetical protein